MTTSRARNGIKNSYENVSGLNILGNRQYTSCEICDDWDQAVVIVKENAQISSPIRHIANN